MTRVPSSSEPAGLARVERSAIDVLRLRGADRVRFLDGQLTCHVAALAPGEGVAGFFPTLKGKVEAPVVVLADDDALWLALPAGLGEAIAARLGKYALFDDVAIDPVTIRRTTLVAEAASADSLARGLELAEAIPPHASTAGASAPWRHGVAETGPAAGCRWVAEPPLCGTVVLSLWCPASEEAGRELGSLQIAPAAPGTWERLRVAAGRPAWSRDFGPEHFPQEASPGAVSDAAESDTESSAKSSTGSSAGSSRQHPTISYTKGCYLGQEVIARIHYRGGVKRRLVRLEGSAVGALPVQGTALLAEDGREAGRLGTVVWSDPAAEVADDPAVAPSAPREWIALAVLHERAADGSTVGLAESLDATPGSGASALVVPIVAPAATPD